MNNTLHLFETPREKGHREWDAFRVVRQDRVGMYRVALPKKPLIARGPQHLLRIISVAPQSHHLREAH